MQILFSKKVADTYLNWVDLHVLFQIRAWSEQLLAMIARIGFSPSVYSIVPDQVADLNKQKFK